MTDQTFTIQMKTINTPGRYILTGQFTTARDAQQWAEENRTERSIIHAEVWNVTKKPKLISTLF